MSNITNPMDPDAQGLEWLVEAFDCDPAALTDAAKLDRLLRTLVGDLSLHPVADPLWHQFPATAAGPGGITGLTLLAESHFACHTYPEHGSLTLNLFCCRPRPDFDFHQYLSREFGAGHVCVRRLPRPYGAHPR